MTIAYPTGKQSIRVVQERLEPKKWVKFYVNVVDVV